MNDPDGFTGFNAAAAETVPEAVTVMDPFHVLTLAGENLDRCRHRVQQQTCGHRGRTSDPPYGIRRVLRTGAELLTAKQKTRLGTVFADDARVQVDAPGCSINAPASPTATPIAPQPRPP